MRRAGRAMAAIVTTVVMMVTMAVSASGAPAAYPDHPVWATGSPVDIATGLKVPWSVLQLHDANNTVLISERDTGTIERVTATGLDPLTTLAGVYHQSGAEDGLLGLATLVIGGTRYLYAYMSTATDNRIVRMVYTDPGDPADATVGAPEVILSGLREARIHNGGRIAFGPDGMLYATVGDTSDHSLPQKVSKLNGKILRMTPTGAVPPDNPFPGSLVYSYGHRNPQGLAWDDNGQLWASELGQDTWDEFNRIVPGGNYGWPIVEGKTSDPRFISPWVQWPTDDASPSGLVYIDGTFFMAALKGTRLWTIYVDEAAHTATATPEYVGSLGRIRDVAEGPGGSLWMLTNNTARGTVRPGDDRLVQVGLVEAGKVTGVIQCTTCDVPDAARFDVTLQRNSDGTWRTYQTARVTSTMTGTEFTFTAVPPGNYRLVTKDAGGDGYLPTTGAAFPVAVSEVVSRTVRVAGSQLDRDLTGDGFGDLLARIPAGTLMRYDGDGAGGFSSPNTVDDAWAGAVATAQVGDFDGDGKADAVTRDAAGVVSLFRGDGAGGWLGSADIGQVPTTDTLLVGPGDWNSDGKADLVTRDKSGTMWLRRGDGAGGLLGAPVRIGSGWAGFTAVAPVGDFSGDRKPDLVARNAAGELLLFRGNGRAGFISKGTRIATGWKSFTAVVSIGDVTGDAHPDILVRAADGRLRVYRGTGTGQLRGVSTLSTDGNGLRFSS